MAVTNNDDVVANDANGSAAETALELMKQLITLSSGLLALSVTFVEKLTALFPWKTALLGVAWLCLISSALAGLETISAIVQARLQPESHRWSEGFGRNAARIAKYSFVAGLVLFAVFGLVVLAEPRHEPSQTGNVNVEAGASITIRK
jgi:hypothetical protein